MSDRTKGIVKWFNNPKGYGFIQALTEDGPDIFVHYTSIVCKPEEYRTLKPSEQVTFELSEGGRGPYALHVVAEARKEELQEELEKLLNSNQAATLAQTGEKAHVGAPIEA